VESKPPKRKPGNRFVAAAQKTAEIRAQPDPGGETSEERVSRENPTPAHAAAVRATSVSLDLLGGIGVSIGETSWLDVSQTALDHLVRP
jgi:hypothetical protein